MQVDVLIFEFFLITLFWSLSFPVRLDWDWPQYDLNTSHQYFFLNTMYCRKKGFCTYTFESTECTVFMARTCLVWLRVFNNEFLCFSLFYQSTVCRSMHNLHLMASRISTAFRRGCGRPRWRVTRTSSCPLPRSVWPPPGIRSTELALGHFTILGVQFGSWDLKTESLRLNWGPKLKTEKCVIICI